MKTYDQLDWQDRFTYRKNILFDESDLRQIGTKFQIVKFAPHTAVGPHAHERVCEIFYVMRGTGTFKFNDNPNLAKAGSVFLCEPHDMHAIENTGDDELVILIYKTNEDPQDIRWQNPADAE